MKIVRLFIAGIFIATAMFLSQCKKKEEQQPVPQPVQSSDQLLFYKSIKTSGFVYYKNNNAVIPSSSPSAHNPYFRVRFNTIAANALTDNGKLPVGGSFPTGSLVVKELYNTETGELKFLAVMEKLPTDTNSGAGWLWGEYYADGTVFNGIADKGAACISCHSTNARDYVRLFDLFP